MLRSFASRLVTPQPATMLGRGIRVPLPAAAATSSAVLTPVDADVNPCAAGGQSGGGSIRCMSKYLSKSATKRLPLTTKRAGKGFYKGNGATKEGYWIKGGKYRLDKNKMLQLMIPDLEGFKLKPYIAAGSSKVPPEDRPPRPGVPQQIPPS